MKAKVQRSQQQGIEAFRRGDWLEAERRFLESLVAGEAAEGWFWLGLARARLGRIAEAAEAFTQAVALMPENAVYHYNLGLALQHGGRLQEACGAYEAALRLDPRQAEAWHNLAAGRTELGDRRQAAAAWLQLLQLELPGDERRFAQEQLYALAFAMLSRGEWTAEAWQAYEKRWDFRPGFVRPATPFPEWDGQDPRGKRLLLWPEQGFGDNLMMFRYACHLAELGAQVTVLASPLLRPLFQHRHEEVAVVSEIDPAISYDAHRPLMGLLAALQVTPATILSPAGYLHPRPIPRPESWGTEPQVGLTWSGGPHAGHDAVRSLPGFQALAPLLQIPGIRFHSLQKGQREDECLESGILQPAREFRDFDDTAAYVQHLDLVISVDTAVAHLAGALGKPVWILLPNPAEWRWYPYADTTPWYPSARLFIQKQPGDWDEVLRRVAQGLEHWHPKPWTTP